MKIASASPMISRRRKVSGHIAVHALENLAASDTGISMLRRTLREQIKRVRDGLDPINVIRDTRSNREIPTNAWNTILSLAEASVHQGEEV